MKLSESNNGTQGMSDPENFSLDADNQVKLFVKVRDFN